MRQLINKLSIALFIIAKAPALLRNNKEKLSYNIKGVNSGPLEDEDPSHELKVTLACHANGHTV